MGVKYFTRDDLKHLGFRNLQTGYDNKNREYSISAEKQVIIGKSTYITKFSSFTYPTAKLRLTLHNLIEQFLDDYTVFEALSDKEKRVFCEENGTKI